MATYYVDSVSGSNAWAGTSASPWQTLAYGVRQVVAGDVIRIVGGSTYAARRTVTENVIINAASCANGTAASPIYIEPNTGQYVEWQFTNGSAGLRFDGRAYWTLRGGSTDDRTTPEPRFQINCNDNSTEGYAVWMLNAASSITLSRIRVFNGDNNPAMIRISSSGSCRIEYCQIYDNDPTPSSDRHGVYISTVGTSAANNNVLAYNHIYDCAGDCLQIQNTTAANAIDGTVIEYNWLQGHTTVPNASENAVDDKDGTNTVIRYNTMWGFRDCPGSLGGTGADGQAIMLHQDSASAQVYGNEIYDISGAAVNCQRPGMLFYRNIIRDFVYEAAIAERSMIYLAHANADGAVITNNTISGSYGASTGNAFRAIAGASFSLVNNIFYNSASVQNAGTTTAVGHNCWYGVTASIAGTGDITSNPLFVGSGDYTLQQSSPCINAGSVFSPYTDGYYGTAPDIGYWEYEPATGGSPTAGESATAVNTSVFGRLVLVIR